MIVAVGLRTDPTIRHFCETAGQFGAAVQLIDLAELSSGRWQLSFTPDQPSWIMTANGRQHSLDPQGAYYCRLIDLGSVCPAQRVGWRTVITAFGGWLELSSGVVVNRPGHVNDNACKPLHEARIAALGYSVPESFTGSRRSDLEAFTSGGPTVAKALSGQRADCRTVMVEDFCAYDDRSGPVHLQRLVEGDDVRAHIIGDEIISVRIASSRTDYRLDSEAIFELCTLPGVMQDMLRSATRSFGLEFAGWDLKIRGSECWVLEANPMPGYSYYDTKLDGRITRALIEYFESRQKGCLRA
jgi:hypothetical protein